MIAAIITASLRIIYFYPKNPLNFALVYSYLRVNYTVIYVYSVTEFENSFTVSERMVYFTLFLYWGLIDFFYSQTPHIGITNIIHDAFCSEIDALEFTKFLIFINNFKILIKITKKFIFLPRNLFIYI